LAFDDGNKNIRWDSEIDREGKAKTAVFIIVIESVHAFHYLKMKSLQPLEGCICLSFRRIS